MDKKSNLLENINALGSRSTWEKSMEIIGEWIAKLKEQGFFEKTKEIDHICFLGCGTSLYAGIVGKYAAEYFAEIHAEAVPAYTFLRYYEGSEMLNGKTLVVGISSTGGTETIEKSLLMAKEAGAVTLAVTSKPDSPIGRAGEYVLQSGPNDDTTIVKSKSFVYSMLALYMLSIEMGVSNGLLEGDKADEFKSALSKLGASAEAFIGANKDIFLGMAQRMVQKPKLFMIGSGPNLGTIEEAALKVVEMARTYAECQELEDFLHGRFRVVDKNSPIFLFAPDGLSNGRIMDFLAVTHEIGAPTIVLTDKATKEMSGLADEIIKMPEGYGEYISVPLYILPFYIIGHKMGEIKGHDPGARRYWLVPQDTKYKKEKAGD